MESEDLSVPPRRINVARWIVQSEQEMDATTLRNAWMRHDLEYFPAGYTPPPSTAIQPVVPTPLTIMMESMIDALPPIPSLPPVEDVITNVSSDDDMMEEELDEDEDLL